LQRIQSPQLFVVPRHVQPQSLDRRLGSCDEIGSLLFRGPGNRRTGTGSLDEPLDPTKGGRLIA
jgi:hypothetical protein